MNKFKLTFSAAAPTPEQAGEYGDVAHVMLQYAVFIDGKLLARTNDWSPVLNASVLLGCNSSDCEYLLTCTCGHAGCVTLPGPDGERIEYPVHMRRDENVVQWVFHRQFFEYLEAQGLASGAPHEATFTFDADEFAAELAAGEQFARDQEVAHTPLPIRMDSMNSWEPEPVERQLNRLELWAVDHGPDA